MRSGMARVVVVVALSVALVGLAALGGCAANTTGSQPAPGLAPVNTNPEPLENPALQDSAAEESESTQPTQAP
jgi:hypothetical protein